MEKQYVASKVKNMKFKVLTILLLSVIILELTYLIISQNQLKLVNHDSLESKTLHFNEPNSGKEVLQDLESLGVRLYNATSYSYSKVFYPYLKESQRIISYNAFSDMARNKIVIASQQFFGGGEEGYIEETVFYLLTEYQFFVFVEYWEIKKEQVEERRIEW